MRLSVRVIVLHTQHYSYGSSSNRFVYDVQRASEYRPQRSSAAAVPARRYVRDVSQQQQQQQPNEDDGSMATVDVDSKRNAFLDFLQSSISNSTRRSKRQSFGRESLCEVNTQFIMPQAALNTQGEHLNLVAALSDFWCGNNQSITFTGDWMYIINQNSQAKQLVKAETCA